MPASSPRFDFRLPPERIVRLPPGRALWAGLTRYQQEVDDRDRSAWLIENALERGASCRTPEPDPCDEDHPDTALENALRNDVIPVVRGAGARGMTCQEAAGAGGSGVTVTELAAFYASSGSLRVLSTLSDWPAAAAHVGERSLWKHVVAGALRARIPPQTLPLPERVAAAARCLKANGVQVPAGRDAHSPWAEAVAAIDAGLRGRPTAETGDVIRLLSVLADPSYGLGLEELLQPECWSRRFPALSSALGSHHLSAAVPEPSLESRRLRL